MRFLAIIFLLFLLSCNEKPSPFPIQEHEQLKIELVSNYKSNEQLLQEVAKQVSHFKVIRSIEFMNGRVGKEIEVYCDSIDRSSNGRSFTIKKISDPKLIAVLKEEGITLGEMETLKSKLDKLNCNSFFSMEQVDINTGEMYIQVELRYNAWNGINFYYYKLFDKALNPSMLSFFKTHLVNVDEGEWKNQGGILDSNAIWYYKN